MQTNNNSNTTSTTPSTNPWIKNVTTTQNFTSNLFGRNPNALKSSSNIFKQQNSSTTSYSNVFNTIQQAPKPSYPQPNNPPPPSTNPIQQTIQQKPPPPNPIQQNVFRRYKQQQINILKKSTSSSQRKNHNIFNQITLPKQGGQGSQNSNNIQQNTTSPQPSPVFFDNGNKKSKEIIKFINPKQQSQKNRQRSISFNKESNSVTNVYQNGNLQKVSENSLLRQSIVKQKINQTPPKVYQEQKKQEKALIRLQSPQTQKVTLQLQDQKGEQPLKQVLQQGKFRSINNPISINQSQKAASQHVPSSPQQKPISRQPQQQPKRQADHRPLSTIKQNSFQSSVNLNKKQSSPPIQFSNFSVQQAQVGAYLDNYSSSQSKFGYLQNYSSSNQTKINHNQNLNQNQKKQTQSYFIKNPSSSQNQRQNSLNPNSISKKNANPAHNNSVEVGIKMTQSLKIQSKSSSNSNSNEYLKELQLKNIFKSQKKQFTQIQQNTKQPLFKILKKEQNHPFSQFKNIQIKHNSKKQIISPTTEALEKQKNIQKIVNQQQRKLNQTQIIQSSNDSNFSMNYSTNRLNNKQNSSSKSLFRTVLKFQTVEEKEVDGGCKVQKGIQIQRQNNNSNDALHEQNNIENLPQLNSLPQNQNHSNQQRLIQQELQVPSTAQRKQTGTFGLLKQQQTESKRQHIKQTKLVRNISFQQDLFQNKSKKIQPNPIITVPPQNNPNPISNPTPNPFTNPSPNPPFSPSNIFSTQKNQQQSPSTRPNIFARNNNDKNKPSSNNLTNASQTDIQKNTSSSLPNQNHSQSVYNPIVVVQNHQNKPRANPLVGIDNNNNNKSSTQLQIKPITHQILAQKQKQNPPSTFSNIFVNNSLSNNSSQKKNQYMQQKSSNNSNNKPITTIFSPIKNKSNPTQTQQPKPTITFGKPKGPQKFIQSGINAQELNRELSNRLNMNLNTNPNSNTNYNNKNNNNNNINDNNNTKPPLFPIPTKQQIKNPSTNNIIKNETKPIQQQQSFTTTNNNKLQLPPQSQPQPQILTTNNTTTLPTWDTSMIIQQFQSTKKNISIFIQYKKLEIIEIKQYVKQNPYKKCLRDMEQNMGKVVRMGNFAALIGQGFYQRVYRDWEVYEEMVRSGKKREEVIRKTNSLGVFLERYREMDERLGKIRQEFVPFRQNRRIEKQREEKKRKQQEQQKSLLFILKIKKNKWASTQCNQNNEQIAKNPQQLIDQQKRQFKSYYMNRIQSILQQKKKFIKQKQQQLAQFDTQQKPQVQFKNLFKCNPKKKPKVQQQSRSRVQSRIQQQQSSHNKNQKPSTQTYKILTFTLIDSKQFYQIMLKKRQQLQLKKYFYQQKQNVIKRFKQPRPYNNSSSRAYSNNIDRNQKSQFVVTIRQIQEKMKKSRLVEEKLEKKKQMVKQDKNGSSSWYQSIVSKIKGLYPQANQQEQSKENTLSLSTSSKLSQTKLTNQPNAHQTYIFYPQTFTKQLQQTLFFQTPQQKPPILTYRQQNLQEQRKQLQIMQKKRQMKQYINTKLNNNLSMFLRNRMGHKPIVIDISGQLNNDL